MMPGSTPGQRPTTETNETCEASMARIPVTATVGACAAVLAAVAGGAQSCGTTSTGPAPAVSTTTAVHNDYTTCPTGWVCGTCPNGTWWGYLDDSKYTNDPQVWHLFFDDRQPCGTGSAP